jgi:allantoicase
MAHATPPTSSAPYTDKVDLAARKYGGSVLYANDDFFADKDNLLKPDKAIFIEGKYTFRGKWMDGWESRRKRGPGHDFAIIRLGLPGIVRGVNIDTAFFTGNFPQSASVEGIALPGQPTVEELLNPDLEWTPLVGRSALAGGSDNLFGSTGGELRVNHLRLSIFPDGGVARLRVYGDVVADLRCLGPVGSDQEVDLAAVEHGGVAVACNDMFFGSRHNLIGPGRAVNMGDGWETKRSRKEAADWIIVQLAAEGTVHRALVDTAHFRGNFPESCGLDGAYIAGDASGAGDLSALPENSWTPILQRSKLQAHTIHDYEREILPHAPITHVRMRIWPDGGVSRLRLFGKATTKGREKLGLRYLAVLTETAREATFYAICSVRSWARAMANHAPYTSLPELQAHAHAEWTKCAASHISEAFAGHPRIGERKPDAQAMGEQQRALAASAETLAELARVNANYEQRFGHIYLVCAAGKSAEELLAIAKARMQHSPAEELVAAADEQAKIIALRLQRLVVRV